MTAAVAGEMDRLAEAASIAAGYPPRWSMDDTSHSDWRLSDKRDSGILWAGRLAAAVGFPGYRLRMSRGFWAGHQDSAAGAGAVSRIRLPHGRWVPAGRMLAAAAARPAVMRLSIPGAPRSGQMSRWAAWDGRELLIAGPELRGPRPFDAWRAGHGVRVEDPGLARAYLEEVGYFA